MMEDDAKSGGSRSSSRGNRYRHHRGNSGQRRDDRRGGDRYGGGDRRRAGGSRDFKMPSLSGPLISYKQFLEMQPFSMDRGESQNLYDDYKQEYEKNQALIFFNLHEKDCWFKEKYDP